MSFNPPHDRQAHELFLTEALELYQQVEIGLSRLAREPHLVTRQKILRGVQIIRQGAQNLELWDLECLSAMLELVLGQDEDELESIQDPAIINTILHTLCKGLKLSLIVHRSSASPAVATEQQNLVLHSLIPNILDSFTSTLIVSLPREAKHQLLLKHTQWFQYWHRTLDLPEFGALVEVTLQAIQETPQSVSAIAAVALAGFQVAHQAALQRCSTHTPTIEGAEILQPGERAENIAQPVNYSFANTLKALNTKQYLVGLASQMIFCIATEKIIEIVLPQLEQQVDQDGTQHLLWHNRLLPLIEFTDLWPQIPSAQATPPHFPSLILVLNLQSTPLALALEVDRLITDSVLALTQFADLTQPTPAYRYGWTLMDGHWLEVVDVNILLQDHFFSGCSWNILSPLSQQLSTDCPESDPFDQTSLRGITADQPQRKTILVIDDSRTIREILDRTLQEAGYGVLLAQNGQEAITYLQQQAAIHLIICDIEMSNLNGFEFLRHRLGDKYWLTIPVLILSSHTSLEYRQLAHKLGAADYCTIPYEPATLLNQIERLFQGIG